MTASVFSMLTGKLVAKHPELGVLVSEDGKVLCINVGNRWGSPNAKFHWAVGTINSYGYREIRIKKKSYFVHRLVAETFIPNPENKPTVDHINRDTTDNRLLNLRWATYSEQRDNSSRVLDAMDLGVRYKDDPKEWQRRLRAIKLQDPEWVEKERTRNREYARLRRQDPEYLKKQAEKARERRAKKKAEQ